MAETMDKVIVAIGYILAIFFGWIGLIFGIILYFVKRDDEFYAKHAKYMIIISLVLGLIALIMVLTGTLALGSMAALG